MYKLIWAVIIFSLIVVYTGCTRNSTGPQSPVLELTAERVESIEVALALKATAGSALGDFEIRRDGIGLFSINAARAETTIVDTTVLPARQYVYQASRRAGGTNQTSNMLTVTTMDTTSHNYRWDIQTIGVFQSSLSDVWGSSSADVYAVGRIGRSDSIDYNAIHFDGQTWTPFYILFTSNPVTIGPPQLFGLYGFSKDDIWAVGVGGIVAHWDGMKWTTICLGIGDNCSSLLSRGEQLTAIWGTSSKDLFAVGDKGVIVHYDGQKWTKMESGTDLTFYDVWGSSSKDVYAVAMDFFSARWVVVHYDGSLWQPVAVDPTPLNRPGGVWGIAKNNLYIASDFVFRFDGAQWKRLRVPNTLYNMGGVEGSAANDIFVVGSFGVVLHWNGAAWRRYDELLKPEGGRLLRRIWMNENGQEVFIVGSGQIEGVILHGHKL